MMLALLSWRLESSDCPCDRSLGKTLMVRLAVAPPVTSFTHHHGGDKCIPCDCPGTGVAGGGGVGSSWKPEPVPSGLPSFSALSLQQPNDEQHRLL